MNKLPDFIQIPTLIMQTEGMTFTDGYLYGLIYWYAKLKLKKCTLSNKRLGEMMGMHFMNISKSINKLKNAGFIDVKIDLENGSKREIIPLIAYGGVNPQIDTPKSRDLDINNKKNIEEEVLTKVNTAEPLQKHDLKEKKYGNAGVNHLINRFEGSFGFKPTDKRPRAEAWNLIRRMKNRMNERGIVPTDENLLRGIDHYMNWVQSQDWSDGVQTMSVVRRKFDMFLATKAKTTSYPKSIST